MAFESINFNDIRIIICAQGYKLDYQFILREIGYCSKNISGVIPFNCKISLKDLDVSSQRTIFALEEEVHGIRLKRNVQFGMTQSDYKAVLKTLYHLSADDSNAKFIGIIRDANIFGLLHRAGLGHFVVDLDQLEIFRHNNLSCPSNVDLRNAMKNNSNKYKVCDIHEHLRNNEFPICAKVKSQFVFDTCKLLSDNLVNQQQNN